MIVPFRYSLSDTSAALLDLLPPALLQETLEHQFESMELEWEPQHVRAAAELCIYVYLTYGPTGTPRKLVELADKLSQQLNISQA